MKEPRKSPLGETYVHFTRKIKTQVLKDAHVPADNLASENIEPLLCGQTGFPDSADSLAYDPIQGLVAVGTPEGRIKISGRKGVEVTLKHSTKIPTLWLGFLPHRGGLVRVTQEGDVQLFSVAEQCWASGILIEDEVIHDVGIVQGEQYLLLACGSGNVRVVSILDIEGEIGMGPAADLQLQPYQILGSDFDAKGPAVALAVTKNGNRPLVAVVHKNSGVLIWDLRAQQVISTALDDENEPSKPTCVCWIGTKSNCFAVGYDDGSILVWGISQFKNGTIADDADIMSREAELVTSIRLVPEGTEAAAIRSLKFVTGNPGTPSGEDCLLVLGGQAATDPDMLTLAPLHPRREHKLVPWFGAIKAVAIVPPSYGAAASLEGHARSLLILTENGRLVSHDLLEWEPTPLTVPVQELPPISAARFVYTLSSSQVAAVSGVNDDSSDEHVLHALSLDKLRACSRVAAGLPGAGSSNTGNFKTPAVLQGLDPAFSGGKKSGLVGTTACGHPSGLLMTGHRDGRIRAWDATAEVPVLLWTMPSFSAGQDRFKPVTTFEVCPLSGIVAVGHVDGDVRLYQFSDRPQSARLMTLDESLVPYDAISSIQPPGFQYVMKYGCHTSDITALALGTRLKIVAVGDASGQVSVLDLMQPSLLFKVQAMTQPIAQLALGGQHLPGQDGDVERIVLFVAGKDSSTCALSLSNGEPVGRTLKPKNASKPLSMTLLDATGMPIPPMYGHVILPWAENEELNVVMPAPKEYREPASRHMNTEPNVRLPTVQHNAPPPQPSPPASVHMEMQEQHVEVEELPYEDDDVSFFGSDEEEGYESPAKVEKKKKQQEKKERKEREKREKKERKEKEGGGGLKSLFRRKSRSPSPEKMVGKKSSTPPPPEEFVTPTLDIPPSPAPTAESVSRSPECLDFDPLTVLDEIPATPLSPLEPEEESLVEYPYIEFLGNEPVLAAYVMIGTTDYLRLYNTESIYLGDRVTDRKARYGAPALCSAVFRSFNGPGVVTLGIDGHLTVHSIPNLTALYSEPIDAEHALGFQWTPVEEGLGQSKTAVGVAACSLDGQLVLLGAGNELTRLAIIKDCALPKGPLWLFDWELAAAHLRNRKEEARHSNAALDVASRAAAGVVSGIRGVVDSATDAVAGIAGGSAGKPKLPSLNTVFAKPVDPLDDLTYWDDDIDAEAAAVAAGGRSGSSPPKLSPGRMATAAWQGAAKQGAKVASMIPMRRAGSRATDDDEQKREEELLGRQAKEAHESGRRSELLGNRKNTAAPPPHSSSSSTANTTKRPPASAPMVKRTTSEIRRVYGAKPSAAKAQAEINKKKLIDRGEKLKDLERQGQDLENGAEDFAGMAKELEDLMSSRPKSIFFR